MNRGLPPTCDSAELEQLNRGMYALVGDEFEAHEKPCYKSFTELHERESAMAKMGVMLDMVKLVVSEEYGRNGRSFAALKAAVGANAYRRI